jgi:hypothetical protein
MSRPVLFAGIFAVLVLGALALLVQYAPPSAQAGPAAAESAPEPQQPQPAERTPDVIYVPTPHEVVAEMLRLTGIGPNDVVYDLGSGDGRLVITAAQKYGARGVGIDIDPERIRESHENLKKSKLGNRVRFIQGDLFQADIREATAITLYLLPSLNVKLRPKLFAELRPGTPIVSHDFDMGDWAPDHSLEVKGPTRTHKVYFWRLPAQVAGEWGWHMGEEDFILHLQQEYQVVNGTVRVNGQEMGLTDVKLDGERLHFTVPPVGRSGARRFSARVRGEEMEGTVVAGGQERDWSARRNRAAPMSTP